MVHFVELRVDVGSGHYPGAGLKVELASGTQERANHDGVVEVTVEAQVADGAAVVAAGGGFQAINELHGAVLGRARERASREGVGHHLQRVGAGSQGGIHLTH